MGQTLSLRRGQLESNISHVSCCLLSMFESEDAGDGFKKHRI